MNILFAIKTSYLKINITFKTICISLIYILFNTPDLKSQVLPIPIIDSVSVTPNNQVSVTWRVASDVNVTRFVIYKKAINDFGYIAIDTVNSSLPYVYVDQEVNAYEDKWLYTVASMSSSDSLSGMSAPHSFIIFDFDKYHLCQSEVDLSWSSYIGASNVSYSTICMSNNVIIDSRNHGYNNSGTVMAVRGQSHLIAVRTTWDGGSSTSAFRSYIADTINISKTSSVSVIQSSETSFNVEVRNNVYRDTDSVILYTYKNNLNNMYSRIAVKPNLSGTTKYTVQTTKDKYFFKSAVVDICGNEYANNLAIGSVLLEYSEVNNDVLLRWNSVIGVPNLDYKLYKDDGRIELIESFASGDSYTYNLGTYAYGAEKICFSIQATNDTISVFSNSVCISLHDDLLWPNAFIPDGDGFDDTFGPIVNRFYPETFEMTIFNKQGVTLFLTRSINRKWDGMHNGNLVPKGAYIFQAEYIISGKKIKKSGIVNVIY